MKRRSDFRRIENLNWNSEKMEYRVFLRSLKEWFRITSWDLSNIKKDLKSNDSVYLYGLTEGRFTLWNFFKELGIEFYKPSPQFSNAEGPVEECGEKYGLPSIIWFIENGANIQEERIDQDDGISLSARYPFFDSTYSIDFHKRWLFYFSDKNLNQTLKDWGTYTNRFSEHTCDLELISKAVEHKLSELRMILEPYKHYFKVNCVQDSYSYRDKCWDVSISMFISELLEMTHGLDNLMDLAIYDEFNPQTLTYAFYKMDFRWFSTLAWEEHYRWRDKMNSLIEVHQHLELDIAQIKSNELRKYAKVFTFVTSLKGKRDSWSDSDPIEQFSYRYF